MDMDMDMVIRLLGYMEVMAIEAGTVTMAATEVVIRLTVGIMAVAVAVTAAVMLGMVAAFTVVTDKNGNIFKQN
jgi:hypothetical protein